MPKLPLDIAAIQELHQAGHLNEAEIAYLALLKEQPNDVLSLHFLGILYVEQAKFEEAYTCFERAATFEPENPVLQLHLANVLKRQGAFERAENILLKAVEAHPDFAAIYNNLGALYFAQEKWQQAADAYQAAIERQANYVDAYYNLGLALNKLKKYSAAAGAFQALVALSPDHVGARFHLGCLLMQKYQNKEALAQFQIIYQAHPYHFETLVNMGACSLRINLLKDAKKYYALAVDVAPADTYVLFNLGVIESQEGHTEQAIAYYLRAIDINPDFYPAQYNVAVSYLALKNREAALQHFQTALRLKPDEAVRHLVNVLKGSAEVTSSPPAYIRSLFDSYADHYDQHVTRSLHYQVPALFGNWIDFAHKQDKRKWNVLDIGCGTGLCGEHVKHMSQHLVGVDISEQMLALAQAKHIYDELICADVQTFLQETNNSFDMVLAGDVMVYFGDLDAVFAAVARVLTPGGWFLFNVEKGDTAEYQLKTSGRFGHAQGYVDRLAGAEHLDIVKFEAAALREQDQEPVLGYLYLLRKR